MNTSTMAPWTRWRATRWCCGGWANTPSGASLSWASAATTIPARGWSGENVIFLLAADGVHVCHLGDLGHLLGEEQVKAIGKVDVLLVPVGGTYTLDAGGAAAVMEQLQPRITIPMHYGIEGLAIPLDSLSRFLAGKTNVHTHASLEVTGDSLPREPLIVVLTLGVPVGN